MKFRTFTQRMAAALSLVLFATTVFAAPTAYQLRVDGLACPFCAYGIEKKLNAIEGVQRIDVDIASGAVAVTMAEGATLDEAAAKKAVKEAGFSLRKFEQVQSAPQGASAGQTK
ncbi:MAG: heavy-metal-associated domain-containing protein [Oxalobacteraceae bacterium]|nr:heavy-metal-associated domain-containing protein [Oxalobacteraceae bacterium]